MLLAIDIGNTSTVLGVFSGEELVAHFRIHTDRMRMESEYRVILKNLFALEDLPPPRRKAPRLGSSSGSGPASGGTWGATGWKGTGTAFSLRRVGGCTGLPLPLVNAKKAFKG